MKTEDIIKRVSENLENVTRTGQGHDIALGLIVASIILAQTKR